jgi:hypothetical protein
VKAGVTPGSTVYAAGAGLWGSPVPPHVSYWGAAVVIVGDMIPERLAQARGFGCETIDLRERIPLGERVAQVLGVPEVDSAVDCVGFEAKGQAEQAGTEQPSTVLNSLMALTPAGGGDRNSRSICHGRSARQGVERAEGRAGPANWAGLGQITQLRNGAVSRASLQSATYDGHPA